MCGIVGYLGHRQATEVLVEGLSKLEYRGYDSAGVAVNTGNELEIRKFKGRLAVLAENLEQNPIQGGLGIGHTRWATHGEPSDVNSHPHFNMDKTIAVVHNGIIENYMELKEELQSEGVKFLSQTDTEVVAHLVDKYYEGNLLDAVYKATQKLRGAYALGVVCADNNNELVAVRKDSPLVVGLGEDENFIASDIPAILKYTRKVYFLENGEFVHIVGDKLTVLDENRNVVEKEVTKITWDVEAASKGGYEHFMLKEIYEQPNGVKETLIRRLNDNGEIQLDDIKMTKEDLDKINRVYIVACGTAYHAGLVGKYAIEKFAKIPVITDIASEFRYRDPFIDDKTLLILVSQSGETADTIAALKLAKEKGLYLIEMNTTFWHPNYAWIRENLDKIGKLQMISCTFCQYSSRYPALLQGKVAPVLDPAYKGGALMDINLYNIHFVVGLFGAPEKVHYYPNIYSNGAEMSISESKVYSVASYIHAHYQDDLSLEGLAQQFGISTSYLSHRFKAVTGFSVTDYVQMTRIRNAQALLINTNIPITEISEPCGFNCFSQFNRVFRKHIGLSPSLYRKQNQMQQTDF